MEIKNFKIEPYRFINYTDLPEDLLKEIYHVRISEQIRLQMDNQNIFSYDEHLKFVDSLKSTENKIYWAVCKENQFILSISIHPVYWEEKWGEWGIYANPVFSGKGFAKEISNFFFEYLAKNSEIETIKARVKPNNLNSFHFHESVGFKKISEDNLSIYMVKSIK